MTRQGQHTFVARAPRKFLSSALLLGSLLTVGALATPALATDKPSTSPVMTTEGPVQGFVQQGVNIFLGIPYAAPPVGAWRWRPPQPPEPWQGVRDATAYANTCPQVTTLGVFAGPTSITEDCLYLNVFTPTVGHSEGHGGGHPVLVWIHGGGNVDGASNDYDGSKLATGGPLGSATVVVTLNYRLGLLGFLAHPALDDEGHPFGNYGILDIQEALRWVQRNIAAFGGDPGNVTLGGQSAGAQDTGANVLSPLSADLFHRAIYQSSPPSVLPSLARAVGRGTNFATAAGCPGTGAAAAVCLRELAVPQILQLQGTANANGPYINGPMVDGTIIPRTPLDAWTTGTFNRVPVLGGNVQDEGTFSIGISQYFSVFASFPNTGQVPISAEQYVASLTAIYTGPAGPGGTPPAYPPGTADAVLAEYPLASYATPMLAYNAVTTHPGTCRANKALGLLSQWVPVYAYEFNYQDAPYYFPPMPGFFPLAAHTIDIQFLFPGWHGGELGVNHTPQNTWTTGEISGPEITLSDQLVAFWTHFAQTGNPNGSGNVPWPLYTPQAGAPAYLSQNIPSLSTLTNAQYRADHHCDFWDTILVY
jgi:para-nitrobenzyl esterase